MERVSVSDAGGEVSLRAGQDGQSYIDLAAT